MADTHETSYKRTPLYSLHLSLGAIMAPFAGYEMPLRYAAGFLNEHLHTRSAAGLFDVSHMGAIHVEGDADLYTKVEQLVPSDILGLQPGAVRYSLLLNERGGAIDDLLIMRPSSDREQRRLLLIVNAAGKERDFAHLRRALGDNASMAMLDDRALLALQGPQAADVLSRYCDAPDRLKFMECGEYPTDGFGELIVSRTGYTGEDGFEICLSADRAEAFAKSLLSSPEAMMIGLGARDSLRLEAGLPLYGHDLDETTTPVEAGMAWVVARRRREQGGFPGASIIRHELQQGPERVRVGVRPEGKAIARDGVEIRSDGRRIGAVTSGGFGPSVSGPIAMGYVETAFAAPETPVELAVRGKALPARVTGLPFLPHRYVR